MIKSFFNVFLTFIVLLNIIAGFVSMKSYRVSKNSSDYSFQSSSKSSNSEIAFAAALEGGEMHFNQQQQQQISNFSSNTHAASAISPTTMEEHHSSTKIYSSTSSCISGLLNEQNTLMFNRNMASPELYLERERGRMSKTHSLDVGSMENVYSLLAHEGVFPPARPPKFSRAKERQFSQTDELDE